MSYTPPAPNNVNFLLSEYTVPLSNAVDFELSDVSPTGMDLKSSTDTRAWLEISVVGPTPYILTSTTETRASLEMLDYSVPESMVLPVTLVRVDTARFNGFIAFDGAFESDARFRYRKTGEVDWIETDWLGLSMSTGESYYIDISGLTEGTEYEVQTQAKNYVGEGEWSSSVEFTTIPTLILESHTRTRMKFYFITSVLDPYTYGTVNGTYEKCGWVVSGRRRFRETTSPRLSEVENVVNTVCSQIHAKMAESGYEINTKSAITAVAPRAITWLGRLNECGAAAEIIMLFAIAGDSLDGSDPSGYWLKTFNDGLNMISGPFLERLGVPKSYHLSSHLVGTFVESSDGEKKHPFFKRGMWDYAGTTYRMTDDGDN